MAGNPGPTPAPGDAAGGQLLGLASLLQLTRMSRRAAEPAALGFLMVNETQRLLPYRQAFLLEFKGKNRLAVRAVSGVDGFDPHAPMLLWLVRLVGRLARDPGLDAPRAFTQETIPQDLQEGWREWSAPHACWQPLTAPDGELLGGLWLTRDTGFSGPEAAITEQLAEAYAQSWQGLRRRPGPAARTLARLAGGPRRWLVAAGAALLLAVPLPLRVLAPAQVTAVSPHLVTAPLAGVIRHFDVEPQQEVIVGQLLFRLDDTELRNRHAVAVKGLEVARAEFQRATQKSLLDQKGSVEMELLRKKVERKEAEVEFAAEELARVAVRAERDGVAVFADVDDWIGRPVAVGERILVIADPAATEIEIEVPVDNAVNLESGAPVRLFLNTDPSRELYGRVRQSSYEAEVTPAGQLAFRVKADFAGGTGPVRIGLRGTARISGERVSLFYHIFRRPLAALRRQLGV